MKESNVIKNLVKLGNVRTDNPFGINKVHSVQGKLSEITVHTQDGEAIIYHVRRRNDVSDTQTDYFAGSMYKNMKGAVAKFLELEK